MTITELDHEILKRPELECYRDRRWRLENLYYITNEDGKKVLFKPNWAQVKLLDNPHYLNIVLKARQLGITTFHAILFLDTCIWNENVNAAILADSGDVARSIFKTKVKFAYDNLPDFIRAWCVSNRDNVNELGFSNGSSYRVSTALRGGTVQLLHITEFAKVCADDRNKAKEIVTGSLNTVHPGNFICIESTARGRTGYFYDYCMDAVKMQETGEELSEMDWKFWFFPWFQHPNYVSTKKATVPKELEEYFNELEVKENVVITYPQRVWYMQKKRMMGDQMMQEYPSTYMEAFESTNEGLYFGKAMSKVRKETRICHVPPQPGARCYSAWDIGVNDATAIWVFSIVGKEIHFHHYYENSDEDAAHYVNWIRGLDLHMERIFLPHDAGHREKGTKKTYADYVRQMGMKVTVLPVERNELFGIERARSQFNRFWFDEKNCYEGIKALDGFRKEWNEKLQTYRQSSLHDWCLAGETKIRTLSGWVEIKDIKEGDYVWGYSLKEKRLIPAQVTKSGKTGTGKKLIEVGLDNGKCIRCTPEHRFMLFDGTWKEAQHLNPQDSLMPFYEVLNRKYIEIDLNDGSFCDEHKFVCRRFHGTSPRHFHTDHIDGNRFNNHPDNLKVLRKEDHCSKTFSGLRTEQRKFVDKTPTDREFYDRANCYQLCKHCKKEYWGSYKTTYCSDTCRNEYRKIRDNSGLVKSRTPEYKKMMYQKRKNHLVRYVRDGGSDDVYDLEVPETDSFVAEGVVVHNSSHGAKALIYTTQALESMPGTRAHTPEEWEQLRKSFV